MGWTLSIHNRMEQGEPEKWWTRYGKEVKSDISYVAIGLGVSLVRAGRWCLLASIEMMPPSTHQAVCQRLFLPTTKIPSFIDGSFVLGRFQVIDPIFRDLNVFQVSGFWGQLDKKL